jgi:glycosyltransferase involved in cell wall biosynthesis
MSSIRVCAITCDCYPNDPLVRRTAEAAMRAGYEYHVICTMKEGQKKYEVFNGVHIHRFSMSRISGKPIATMFLLWSIFTFLAFWKVTALHFKHKFDVIHAHNMPDFLVFAALIPKLLGAKVILHVQDVSPELMVAKTKGRLRGITFLLASWQERVSTTFANYVLTVGWPFEELLLKRGIPQKKLTSILNSADPHLFSEEKRTEPFQGEATAERPLILMYHGTFAERAGLDIAVRAFVKARTVAPHLRLYFKGSGVTYLPYLKQLVQELGVTDHVVFFPGGPVDEVVDFVEQGDIGIIPYRSDGFADLLLPTKAYEYALMRRPMIVSNTTAIRSMFRPESLILCEPSSVDSFAEAIIDLYQHPEKRAQLVVDAEQDYAPYRWELMAERYRQVLASLAANSHKR